MILITRTFPLNEKNKNGRIYSKEQFENIDLSNPMLGELGHPQENADEINLHRSSHQILHVKAHENEVEIAADVFHENFNSKEGNDLLDDMVLAPRGIGTVNEDGSIKEFELITFDLIHKDTASWNT